MQTSFHAHKLASRRRAAVLVAALLAGCATPLPPEPAPTPAPAQSDAERYPPPRPRAPPPAPSAAALPAGESAPLALGTPAEPAPLPPLAEPARPAVGEPAAASTMPPRTPPAPHATRQMPSAAAGSAFATTMLQKRVEAPPPLAAGAPPSPPAPRAPAPAPAETTNAGREPARPAPAAGAGRWAVQVGVFAVARNADTIRARVDQQLAAAAVEPAQRLTEVVQRDGRSHVLVGDLPDRASAQRLAARLRELLKQDVVLFQR